MGAGGIYGCHWRKCNIRTADTDRFDCRTIFMRAEDFLQASRISVGVTLFSVYFFSSRDREINRSKSETRAARIRISFVGRFDLWKLVSIFFLPTERITLLAARNSNQSVSRTYYSTPLQSLAAQVRCNVEHSVPVALLNKGRIFVPYQLLIKPIIWRKN